MATRKWTIISHIHSRLGQNACGRISANARHAACEFDLFLVGFESVQDFVVKVMDHVFDGD